MPLHITLPPHPCGTVPLKTYYIMWSLVLYGLSWSLWYYGALYGQTIKDKILITTSDTWPGIMMALSFFFAVDCRGRATFNTARRAGDFCTVESCKTICGGALFVGGFFSALLMALSRFIMPILPGQAIAKSMVPGWCLIGHAMLMMAVVYIIMRIPSIPTTATVASPNAIS